MKFINKLFPFLVRKNNSNKFFAQFKFRESNELFFSLFYNTTIGLYQTTPEGKILSANPAIIKMLKFDSLEDLLNRDLTKGSYVDKNKRIEFKKLLQEKGEITDFESEWYTKNGEIIYVIEGARAVRNTNGDIIRYDGAVLNITDKKNTEIALKYALEKAQESDKLKSAFLANMSHEIRTPMNGIMGFAELLKEPDLNSEKQKEYINIIENSGARMLNIINDIIDISKIEAGLMQTVINESNINQQIECIYTFFKPEVERKGMTFSFKNTLPENESIIKTDREKVFSVLTNLVKNAIKYSIKGEIEIENTVKSNELVIYVKDQGIGIPKDRQDAIFERFIQADVEDKMARQGAGLGLAISKSYVEMLGGKIWVESESGVGSSFFFTLPYQTKTKEEKKDEKLVTVKEKESHIHNLKILIAEDDSTSEMLISIMMQKYSSEILKTKTGNDTVKLCRKNPDINLILMDIQMPDLDGYNAIRQIRQFNKEVIIIAQTAYGLNGDRDKSIQAGCNDYITKPINKEDLNKLIQKYFKK